MAAERIIVDTARLGQDAQEVYGLIRAMENDLKDMSASVRQMGRMWEGESKAAFTAAFERDWRQASEMLAELKGIYAFENEAKERYDRCERQAADIAASISI